MKILIAGASGLVGTALSHGLRAGGHTVGRFVRPGGLPRGDTDSSNDVRWDPAAGAIDAEALAGMEGADAVVNLGGAGIAEGRWTPERKALLRSSRVQSTRLLVGALAQLKQKPRVFLSASAVGYYGNRGDEILTESSPAGGDFLASVAQEWEAESARAESIDTRTVILRFGVVLSAQGGALPQMLRPFRFGVGGRLGSGLQWISWVALPDAVSILSAAIADDRYDGPLNVVAPDPIRNAEFTKVAAHVLHRPAIFPAPAFALKLMLGEMADVLLASQRAVPERLLVAGHSFALPEFEAALRFLLGDGR